VPQTRWNLILANFRAWLKARKRALGFFGQLSI
jgi:hypothetical protein